MEVAGAVAGEVVINDCGAGKENRKRRTNCHLVEVNWDSAAKAEAGAWKAKKSLTY
jgi:hypothetical protein